MASKECAKPRQSPNTPIADLANLGPASAEWLEAGGICTKADLMNVGPVVAFEMAEQAGFKPGLNLLCAMAGAMAGVKWSDVSAERKAALRRQVQD